MAATTANISETVALTEGLATVQQNALGVSETVTLAEAVRPLQVTVVDGYTVRIDFSDGMQLADVANVGNYVLRPLTSGVPVALLQALPETSQVQSGTTGKVLDLGRPDGLSDQFLVPTGVFTADHIGDYVEVTNGQNAGKYQILSVLAPTLVRLSAALVVADRYNGYLGGQVEIVDALTSTFRLNVPGVEVSDPITHVDRVEDRTTMGIPSVNPTTVLVDYRTFRTPDFAVTAGDRVIANVQTSSKIAWAHTRAPRSVTLSVFPKLTAATDYFLEVQNLRLKGPSPVPPPSLRVTFQASYSAVPKPRAVSATYLPDDGTVLVQFNQTMRVDDLNLGNPRDYTITGPSVVKVQRVSALNDTTVALHTSGMDTGSYSLVISTSTPKDVAGNPLDPSFNTLIFTSSLPHTTRSIFTDKGPIAKPPQTLQTGVAGTIQTYNEVTLTGATLSSGLVGKMVRITGSSINGGSFRIAAIVSTTRARLANASFTLPDASTISWTIYDPRDGQIADDPTDVVVRVNNVPVVPEAVVGLLGQILLPTAPGPTDDVKVDYSWVSNPVVEVRRLNSKEFRLNAWNRDTGYLNDGSQHKYRFNNVLVQSSNYIADNMSAPLEQPKSRELHYRAFERAYTPVLNDPSLLLLNSPIHRIAFPPAARQLTEEFVNYEGQGLPEASIVSPWTREGTGTATSALGQLTVVDDASGPYPMGKPIFWVRPLDLSFPHVFAMSWRFVLTAPTLPDGVWTGVAAGYTTESVAVVIGYILDGATRKIGILKRGFGDDPSSLAAWTGGLDNTSNPTDAPAAVGWNVLHSFRVFRDLNGTIRVFVDGDVVETLRVTESELPFLEELAAPFNTLQGAFFGAPSRPSKSTSVWDFVRYLILPTNPTQTGPSSFVSYEANVVPESDAKPWTPVGYHGTETILGSDTLLLDSTSATDTATAADVGLVGGDFRSFVRLEPLLSVASQYVLDADLQLRTCTHGVSPYGVTMAVDDGERLTQLCFFPDKATPKVSYGGRSLPEDFSPFVWTKVGAAPATMKGRVLQISDSTIGDGAVYAIDDTAPIGSDARVAGSSTDYMIETRCKVLSYTADGAGFCGAFAQAFDSARSVGFMLQEVSGTKYVSFHSDGVTLGVSARFAFNWGDGLFHTYRVTKSTGGDLVSLFADGVFLGSFPYSSFLAPAPDPIGQISFGSATPVSSASLSVVEWAYANAWRVRSDLKRYVGIWKGSDGDTLLGYHLPLKTSGKAASVVGNALGDGNADFFAANVVAGDKIIVDSGSNRGVYEVAGVSTAQSLTIVGSWVSQPSLVDYRIAKETDWSVSHKYRLVRDPSGETAVLFDADPVPLIRVGYNSIDLPQSGVGVVKTLSNGLPAIVFGSLDSENLAQSSWEYVRYGITRTPNEMRIAPHHQVLNQWNMMGSPERLFSALPHILTSFKSSSTGIVPKQDPDFLADPGLTAWTVLNQDTPLVPLTQNFQTRGPYPVQTFVSALNRPEDVLNSDGDFTLNDSAIRYELIIPKDVLYSSLDIIEQASGEDNLLAPFTDNGFPSFGTLQYQKETCLVYDASTLPENDPTAQTPWTLASDNPAQVTASAVGGILTYGTGGTGTKTLYRNDTPLPDAPSLQNEVKFRVRLLQDSTGGTGDSQVKLGLSAPGLTVALAFVTSPLGERLVLVVDLHNGTVLGSTSFDFLDGAYHTYRIVRDPGAGEVRVFIDA